jgi:hypothetical protein
VGTISPLDQLQSDDMQSKLKAQILGKACLRTRAYQQDLPIRLLEILQARTKNIAYNQRRLIIFFST